MMPAPSSGSSPIPNGSSTVPQVAVHVFHCISSLCQKDLSVLPFPDCKILPGSHLSPVWGHLCWLSRSQLTPLLNFQKHSSDCCAHGRNISGRPGMPWKWRLCLGELLIPSPNPMTGPCAPGWEFSRTPKGFLVKCPRLSEPSHFHTNEICEQRPWELIKLLGHSYAQTWASMHLSSTPAEWHHRPMFSFLNSLIFDFSGSQISWIF